MRALLLAIAVLTQAPSFSLVQDGEAHGDPPYLLEDGWEPLLVQKDVDVAGPTRSALNLPEGPSHPLMLQGDHGPVAFRNIHVRPLRALHVP